MAMSSFSKTFNEDACCGGLSFPKRPRAVVDERSGRTLLAEEMNGLTVNERQQLFDELHGVEDVVEETPEFVRGKLQEMRVALAKVPKAKKKALDRALFLRPGLEDDDKFYLMFLRCERFDATAAAEKLCRHFEHKLVLFGDEALPRDITLDDMSEMDMECIYRAANLFLPAKDRKGRTIRVLSSLSFVPDWKVIGRSCWYQVMAAIEDENVQKAGMVNIVNLCEEREYPLGKSAEAIKNCMAILKDWPIRTCGMHFLYDNAALRPFVDFTFMVMGKDYRLRERTHFGSDLETRYSLMSFGIVISESFKRGHGLRSRKQVDAYLKERRRVDATKKAELEAAIARDQIIPYPNPADILMGRSRIWIGNDHYADLINSCKDKYQTATERLDKTMIAMEVLQRIQINGGRFLERTDRGWKAIPDSVAKDKISQALRIACLKQKDTRTAGSASPPRIESDDDSSFMPIAKPITSMAMDTDDLFMFSFESSNKKARMLEDLEDLIV